MKKILTLGSLVALFAGGLIAMTPGGRAAAANLSQFQAGNIIDNVTFTDNTSMTAAQIQDFLVQKNSVCLKDFRSLSLHDDNGDGVVQDSTTEQYGPGTMSAAELIKAASDIYRISPKVILVTLQKEQGLITRQDCPAWRYNTALGYGCPDSSPCDQSAFGFTRQIDYGAYHFRGFYDDTLLSVPYGTGNQSIPYNPDGSCGSSVVNIQNRATASLYSYTPYQPNAASLAAGYGEAPPCGSYGNRNFYNYFTDWFGSTFAPNYSWSYAGQTVYTDNTKAQTVDSNTTSLKPGGRYYFALKAKNTGNQTWTQGTLKLGTSRNIDRGSLIYDPSWLSPTRPATLVENSVAPGDTGTFEFWVKIPESSVDLREYFNLVREGITWLNDPGLSYRVRTAGSYTWSFISQASYTDSSKSQSVDTYSSPLQPSGRYYFIIKARNTGDVTWYKGNLRIGTARNIDRSSGIYDSSWISTTRPATLTEDSVPPGGIGTFEFWVTIPSTPLNTKEYFNLVQEHLTWLNDLGMHYIIQSGVDYAWQWGGQGVYTDSSKSTPIDNNTQTLTPNTRYYAVVRAKNIGTQTWQRGNFRLGTTQSLNRSSTVCEGTWINCGRPATLTEQSVAPGAVGTFEFWFTTPGADQNIKEYFNPLQENVVWLNDIGLNFALRT